MSFLAPSLPPAMAARNFPRTPWPTIAPAIVPPTPPATLAPVLAVLVIPFLALVKAFLVGSSLPLAPRPKPIPAAPLDGNKSLSNLGAL